MKETTFFPGHQVDVPAVFPQSAWTQSLDLDIVSVAIHCAVDQPFRARLFCQDFAKSTEIYPFADASTMTLKDANAGLEWIKVLCDPESFFDHIAVVVVLHAFFRNSANDFFCNAQRQEFWHRK